MKDSHEHDVHVALAKQLGIETHEIQASQHLERDLGLDSLDLVLVALRLEELERIDFPIAELANARTVGDLTNIFRAWTLASDLGTVVLTPGRPIPPGIETLRQRVRRTTDSVRRMRAHRAHRHAARIEDTALS